MWWERMRAENEELTIMGIGKYPGLSNLEFEMKQNRSFINICSIVLCPKTVHGILIIEIYIIQPKEQTNKKY